MVPLAVTARNEERTIGQCLESLVAAVERAEAELPLRFDLVVVLDECRDGTGDIARSFSRVRTIESRGGIVEAQRTVAGRKPFVIFSDADILVDPGTVSALVSTLLEHPEVQVAYPRKLPIPPRRCSLLARALYAYNLHDGFQTARSYFNGKFFAIRDWRVPALEDLQERLRRLPVDRFYDYHSGMRVDDIYLSRDILTRYGPGAIREVEEGCIRYRPAETFRGMYRTYLRMRMEIERLNVLLPDTRPVHRTYGIRRHDRAAFRRASRRDRWLWRYFQLALLVCRARYVMERFYYQRISLKERRPWEPVEESKYPL